MSFQDSNQQSGPQGSWGGPEPQQQGSWGAPQQQPDQSQGQGQAWGSQQPQIPRQPNYAGYGQQSGAGQSYGQPQDYPQQGYPQPGQSQSQSQGFAAPGYASGPGYGGESGGFPPGQSGVPGYPPQSDFGSGTGYGYPPAPQGNSGLATTALWLGILGGWGLINLVISILAINDTGPGKKAGRNKAVIGLCLTLAWTVVWIGVAVALMNHAKTEIASAAPSNTVVATSATSATAGSGAGGGSGVNANGANGDPGCQAAQSAFNTYGKQGVSGGLAAIKTLGGALQSASSQSQVASSQLKTMGGDYLSLADGTAPPSMVGDLEALDSACGMTFTMG